MKDTLIAGLWLALLIALPAATSYPRLGLGLFLVMFLVFGVAPIVRGRSG